MEGASGGGETQPPPLPFLVSQYGDDDLKATPSHDSDGAPRAKGDKGVLAFVVPGPPGRGGWGGGYLEAGGWIVSPRLRTCHSLGLPIGNGGSSEGNEGC